MASTHLGEMFQAECRTPQWKAAMIVFEKYKRKFSLEHKHLLVLRDHVLSFSEKRSSLGKQTSKDFLVQEASAFLKRTWGSVATN